jgi:hypothetical protein
VLPLEKKRKPGDGCTVEWERRCCFTRPLKACAEEAQAKSGETGQVVGYACDWSRVREFLPLALGIASVLLLAVDVRNTLDLLVSVPQSELTLVNVVPLPIQQPSAKFRIGSLGTVPAVSSRRRGALHRLRRTQRIGARPVPRGCRSLPTYTILVDRWLILSLLPYAYLFLAVAKRLPMRRVRCAGQATLASQ